MTNPYRDLCANLTAALNDWQCETGDDRYKGLIARARALLAEPEAVGLEPTHEQISQWINANPVLRPGSTGGPMIRVGTDWLAAFADAARWGARFRPAPRPGADPPGPEDCDVEGKVWGTAELGGWMRVHHSKIGRWRAWLPANALPTPEATND